MDAMSLVAASRAIARTGRRIVVSAGLILVASALSSNPATDKSRGTERPISVAVWITPAAMSSLLAKMAVGVPWRPE